MKRQKSSPVRPSGLNLLSSSTPVSPGNARGTIVRVRVLLISTYDLGRQPFGLASPAAWLRQQGVEVACADLSRERLPEDALRAADLIGFYLPMHTATRLALPVIDLVRTVNPHARLCAYGLYAPLNTALLTARGVTHVLGAEFEGALVDLALGRSDETKDARPGALPRLSFRPPDRTLLPPLARYATLQVGRERRTTGSTETTRTPVPSRSRRSPSVIPRTAYFVPQ